ncbi:MAG: outer membrane protein assembly factor [Bacteroidales bacterium]|jgi:hypothetical protein|nr:outer membrane protein assembly factor [Bacteroidales bacterium]
MKNKIYLLILLFSCLLSNNIFPNNVQKNDSVNENIKTGWSFLPIPMFSYTSGVGLTFGLNMQMYNYGDGKIYPNLYNLILVQGEYVTSNAGSGRVFFYSGKFLKYFEFVADAGYFVEKNYQFRGFNGFMSVLGNESSYYTFSRNHFAGFLELYKPVYKDLKIAAGIEMFSFDIKPKEGESLFADYVSEGIIDENQINGGNNMYFKLGLIYDSRDVKKVPSKGMYSFASIMYSPDFFDKRNLSHLIFTAQHSHFINLWKRKLQFAYRLVYQGVIAGDCPFYLLPRMHSFNQSRSNVEGVGGAYTVRGIDLVRIVGNSVFYSNFEFRYTPFSFRLWIWDVDLCVNLFFDMGLAVSPYHKEQMFNALENGRSDIIYNTNNDAIHSSYGIGGKIILNKTTVLSGEIGFPVDKRDREFGVFFGVDFLF